jgi:hypothetical protein
MAQRNVGTLTSFGSRTFDGTKYVLPGSVTLQGDTTGAGAWATIPADQYYTAFFAGQIAQRGVDDSAAVVDWSSYFAYRSTYSVNVSGTITAYTNETVTFAPEVDGDGNEIHFSPVLPDGRILDLAAIDLIAQIVIAGGGAVTIDANGISIQQGSGVPNAVVWRNGATEVGRITVYDAGGGEYIFAITNGTTGNFSINGTTGEISLLGPTLAQENVTMGEGKNIVLGTTTGTKIGTGASQKLGFFNKTPRVQYATAGGTSGFVDTLGIAIVHNESTFQGYTIIDMVNALKAYGLLA